MDTENKGGGLPEGARVKQKVKEIKGMKRHKLPVK